MINAPIKAATIKETYGPHMVKRYIVMIDQDAAEILGETKLRYVFDSMIGARKFAETVQSNLDASFSS